MHKTKRQPARVGVFAKTFLVDRGGIEPPTQGFSKQGSTARANERLYQVGREGEVPNASAKPHVHKDQTHAFCVCPQADDEIEISQQGNRLNLTVPDYPDPKTHLPLAKTYTYIIGG